MMRTIITKNSAGKYVAVTPEKLPGNQGINYCASCRTGTGLCGGYSLDGVVEMAADYATPYNLIRARNAYLERWQKPEKLSDFELDYK